LAIASSENSARSNYQSRVRAGTMMGKNSANRKILLVEDSEDARYFMRLELEQLGFSVIEAEDGVQAVQKALQEQPDIVLMDLSLPTMDGLEATKQIRKDDRLRSIPIIAVTAHQDFRQGAKASGFDAYVTKPIDIDWLSELINGLLL
jgi:two-component system, cell cycle response regulator DivK